KKTYTHTHTYTLTDSGINAHENYPQKQCFAHYFFPSILSSRSEILRIALDNSRTSCRVSHVWRSIFISASIGRISTFEPGTRDLKRLLISWKAVMLFPPVGAFPVMWVRTISRNSCIGKFGPGSVWSVSPQIRASKCVETPFTPRASSGPVTNFAGIPYARHHCATFQAPIV